MLKKTIFLAGLILALTAFGFASAASATEWTMGGEPLGEEEVTAEFEGNIAFETESGTVDCPMGFTLNPTDNPTETTVKSFYIGWGCKVTGVFKTCYVLGSGHQGTKLPWKVDLEANSFTVKDVYIDFKLNTTCSPDSFEVYYPKTKITPPDPKKIPNGIASGEGESNFGSVSIASEFEGEASDEYTELGEAEGTFGISE